MSSTAARPVSTIEGWNSKRRPNLGPANGEAAGSRRMLIRQRIRGLHFDRGRETERHAFQFEQPGAPVSRFRVHRGGKVRNFIGESGFPFVDLLPDFE